MGLRELFFPPKRDFVKMLRTQAEKTCEGMKALHDFMQTPEESRGKLVMQLEEEADEMRRVLVDELNRSFVTPFDREDIFSLSRAVDDMVDYAKSTVEEMTLFGVTESNDHMRKMTEGLHNAAKDIVASINSLLSHPGVCTQHLIRAKKAENFVEHRYREALAELFKTQDVVHILKMREIYRHLSNAADRGDEAADIIGDIVVKTS
jgi:predicted phosphate transport protein (TIGR00153 family)